MNIHIIYHQGARFQTWNWDKICILRTFTHDGLDCQLANWLCPLWLSNSSWWNHAKVAITGFAHDNWFVGMCLQSSKPINHLFTTIKRTCQHKKSQKSRCFQTGWRPHQAVCRTLIYLVLSFSLSFFPPSRLAAAAQWVGQGAAGSGSQGGSTNSLKTPPSPWPHTRRQQIVEVLHQVSVKCFN